MNRKEGYVRAGLLLGPALTEQNAIASSKFTITRGWKELFLATGHLDRE